VSDDTQLPHGWRRVSLDECAEVIQGQSPPGTSYNTKGDGLPFFQGKAEFGPTYPTIVKWTSQTTKIAEPEDVLISIRAPVGPTNLSPKRACIGRGLAAIRPSERIPSRYLLYAMRDSERALASQSSGSTFDAISGATLRAHSIALAPLPEQHRIVAEIEQQFTRLDAAVAALERVRANLKRYRAATLAAACEGRLVPMEGEANSNGQNRLPVAWDVRTVAEIATVQGGIQKQPKRAPRDNAFPYLRVANVLRGRLDLAEIHQMELFGNEFERLRLERGDLLVVEGNGSPSEIGRMAIWNGAIENCVHQNHIIRVRCREGIEPRFVEVFWNSPAGSDQVKAVASSTSGLYTLSVSKLSKLRVPIPPPPEQQRIVAEVERRLSLVENLEAVLTNAERHTTSLRQSILKRAFEGKLVPQDPNDEPATILLERIRKERAAASSNGSGPKRPGRRTVRA